MVPRGKSPQSAIVLCSNQRGTSSTVGSSAISTHGSESLFIYVTIDQQLKKLESWPIKSTSNAKTEPSLWISLRIESWGSRPPCLKLTLTLSSLRTFTIGVRTILRTTWSTKSKGTFSFPRWRKATFHFWTLAWPVQSWSLRTLWCKELIPTGKMR